MKMSGASDENTGLTRRRRCGVRQLAAALIPRACSRPRPSEDAYPCTASKLAWGKAVASYPTPERFAHFHVQCEPEGHVDLRGE